MDVPISPLPATSSVYAGAAVPMPTLPPTSTKAVSSPSAQLLVYNAIWLASADPSPVTLEHEGVTVRAPAPFLVVLFPLPPVCTVPTTEVAPLPEVAALCEAESM